MYKAKENSTGKKTEKAIMLEIDNIMKKIKKLSRQDRELTTEIIKRR